MAWTYANQIGASMCTGDQLDGYYFNFGNHRTMQGSIELQITDVSFADGYQFSWFDVRFCVKDDNNNQYGNSGLLTKYWGANTAWTNIGFASNPTPLFLAAYNAFDNRGGEGYWFDFTANLRWDNYGGTA